MELQNLLTLQEEDACLRELQRELKVLLPKRRADAKARLQKARDAVELATQANLAAKKELAKFQRDYTQQHERLDHISRNSANVTSMRALNAAQAEHDAATSAAATAEAGMHAADQNLSPTERQLDDARAFEAKEEIDVQEMYNAIEARKALVEEEIVKVKARREELAAAVPAAQLKHYERLSLTRWPCVAVYNRTEGVCTGCNLVQPRSVTQAVIHADTASTGPLVTCPACGRILI